MNPYSHMQSFRNINKQPQRNRSMLPETLLTDIISFAYSDSDEWQRALDEFLGSLEGNEPTEEEMDQFETDYVFARKHSKYNKTFVRLFVECFEELYGKELSRDIITLEENFDSYFEVKEIKKDSLVIKDLILEDTFEVDYPPVEYVITQGDILEGKVFTWKGTYFFFGPLLLYDEEEAKETMRIFTDVVRESYENATQSFLEYFGSNVVIFADRTELEQKLNEFLYWFFRNKTLPGVFNEGDTFTPVTFEEVNEKKEIGLVIDHDMGQIVIPEYGYAERLFSGNWGEVPDFEEMVKRLLYTDDIPSYFVQEMIEKYPESSVTLYSQFFPKVKTKEDLIDLFVKCRRDWGRKPRRNGTLFEG